MPPSEYATYTLSEASIAILKSSVVAESICVPLLQVAPLSVEVLKAKPPGVSLPELYITMKVLFVDWIILRCSDVEVALTEELLPTVAARTDGAGLKIKT